MEVPDRQRCCREHREVCLVGFPEAVALDLVVAKESAVESNLVVDPLAVLVRVGVQVEVLAPVLGS